LKKQAISNSENSNFGNSTQSKHSFELKIVPFKEYFLDVRIQPQELKRQELWYRKLWRTHYYLKYSIITNLKIGTAKTAN
jgi:hypothetical protein